MAAGWHHSVALTKEHNVYTTGLGQYGQLGHENEESKTLFTWVKKLGGRKVINVSAGGHHTWCVLDQYERKVPNYSPPTPLKTTPVASPEHDYRREVSPDVSGIKAEKKVAKPKTDVKLDHMLLQLIFSGQKHSHRMVRVSIQDRQREVFNKAFVQYIKTVNEDEGALVFYTIKEDEPLFQQVNRVVDSDKQ